MEKLSRRKFLRLGGLSTTSVALAKSPQVPQSTETDPFLTRAVDYVYNQLLFLQINKLAETNAKPLELSPADQEHLGRYMHDYPNAQELFRACLADELPPLPGIIPFARALTIDGLYLSNPSIPIGTTFNNKALQKLWQESFILFLHHNIPELPEQNPHNFSALIFPHLRTGNNSDPVNEGVNVWVLSGSSIVRAYAETMRKTGSYSDQVVFVDWLNKGNLTLVAPIIRAIDSGAESPAQPLPSNQPVSEL